MPKFTVTHEINCNPTTFWKLFFDRDFNDKLYLEELGYSEFKILEKDETDTQISCKLTTKPKMNLPAPVAKLLSTNYRYMEEGPFDKATQVYRWKRIPSTQPDKIRFEGSIRIEPIGDSKVRRIADITVECKIFGIGGLMESTFEKEMRYEFDQSAAYFNKSLAQQ